MIALVQAVVINQIWTVYIEQCAEREAIVPARRKVPDLHLFVACCLPLAPQKQTFLRTEPLLVDIADREAQNQCPYQPENDLAIAVDHIFCAYVDHLYAPALDEVQTFVRIFEFLHPQFRLRCVSSE